LARGGLGWFSSATRLTVVFVAACLVSCSRPSGPDTYPATGTVTLEGTAVEDAVVVFYPRNVETDSMQAAQANTDTEGRFELSTHVERDVYKDGIRPGDYDVTVTKLEVVHDMRRRPKHLLPRKYSSPRTSKLSATVQPSSDNDFTFALEK
jgi:hypothetical protein